MLINFRRMMYLFLMNKSIIDFRLDIINLNAVVEWNASVNLLLLNFLYLVFFFKVIGIDWYLSDFCNFVCDTISARNDNAANYWNGCSVQPCDGIWNDETTFIESQMATMGKFHVQCVSVFACIQKKREFLVSIIALRWRGEMVDEFQTYWHVLWSV